MNIYVGNLSHEVTEEGLQEAFASFGHVASVNVVKDRWRGSSFAVEREEARSVGNKTRNPLPQHEEAR
jgi:RNA recognition motif-containing protein